MASHFFKQEKVGDLQTQILDSNVDGTAVCISCREVTFHIQTLLSASLRTPCSDRIDETRRHFDSLNMKIISHRCQFKTNALLQTRFIYQRYGENIASHTVIRRVTERKPKVAKRSLRQLLKLFGIFLTRLEEEPEEELNGDLKHITNRTSFYRMQMIKYVSGYCLCLEQKHCTPFTSQHIEPPTQRYFKLSHHAVPVIKYTRRLTCTHSTARVKRKQVWNSREGPGPPSNRKCSIQARLRHLLSTDPASVSSTVSVVPDSHN